MNEHCMIDLETLSTRSQAAIVSIGAVIFDSYGIHKTFYQPVRWSDDMLQGLVPNSVFHVEQSTLSWWERQSEVARLVFSDPNGTFIHDALQRFARWVRDESIDWEQLRVWGNGASFDNAILSNAYWRCEMEQPWKHWNDRCYRTVKNMHPNIKAKRVGEHHNALDDAMTQAQHLLAMNAYLN